MKHNLILNFFIFFYLINLCGKIQTAVVEIGKAIIPNECGSLGENNPLQLLDCSIFQLEKGMCCLLTITFQRKRDDNSTEEYCKTACIYLEKVNAKIINESTIKYKSLGGDVLIECSQFYIYKYFIIELLFIFLILL